jgi:hypothetical protein
LDNDIKAATMSFGYGLVGRRKEYMLDFCDEKSCME